MATTTPEPGQQFQFEKPVPGTPVLAEEVRDNFTALGQTHYTTDPAYPKNPRPGMKRILAEDPNNVKEQVFLLGSGGGGAWQTTLQKIHLGIAAPAKIIVRFGSPLAVWTIDHNLGELALVQVLNAANKQKTPVVSAPGADECIVEHVITPLVQRVIITHSAPVTGAVIIVG